MSKTLRTAPQNVNPPKTAGYTINFGGSKAYVRTTYTGIMAVLRVLDQLRKGAK